MIELTDEMRERIARALDDGCPVIAASVDGDGQPKISFYGSTHVFSGDQLAIWVRSPESGVLRRLASNPRMALLYRNSKEKVAWQFFGRGRVVTDPELRDRVYAGAHEIERALDPDRKGVAVIVDLDRVTGRGGLDMRRETAPQAT